MRTTELRTWLCVGATATVLGSCTAQRSDNAKEASDSGYAATQQRGAQVMGVDQYTSAHVFEDLPDGGRMVLERNDGRDSAGIATIRQHMRSIASDFRAGEFSKPFAVHAETVPGTPEMAARRANITYEPMDRPRGAEVRIRSTDTVAVRAIHEFFAYQRGAHHAAGHETMPRDMRPGQADSGSSPTREK